MTEIIPSDTYYDIGEPRKEWDAVYFERTPESQKFIDEALKLMREANKYRWWCEFLKLSEFKEKDEEVNK